MANLNARKKKYILLNFAYGFGPFLRTAELAVAVNDVLERETGERFQIIVPLVYGDNQKKIMREEFGEIINKNPGEFLLDAQLGGQLDLIFYGGYDYAQSLKKMFSNYEAVQERINRYIANGLTVADFSGREFKIDKEEIAFEIGRAPRVVFGIQPAYYTSFAFVSDILLQTRREKFLDIEDALLEKATALNKMIEEKYNLHFIAEPGTFSHLDDIMGQHKSVIMTPPNIATPHSLDYDKVEPGVYVTVTGIPGLDELFAQVEKIGLKIYTNKPEVVKTGVSMPPHVLGHHKIVLHFARGGWGAIWLSLLTGVPFVTPPYSGKDDPEVYFNNKCLESLGLGKVYQGETLPDLLLYIEEFKAKAMETRQRLIEKYGTLEGVKYTAEIIVKNFLATL